MQRKKGRAACPYPCGASNRHERKGSRLRKMAPICRAGVSSQCGKTLREGDGEDRGEDRCRAKARCGGQSSVSSKVSVWRKRQRGSREYTGALHSRLDQHPAAARVIFKIKCRAPPLEGSPSESPYDSANSHEPMMPPRHSDNFGEIRARLQPNIPKVHLSDHNREAHTSLLSANTRQ